MTRHAALSAAGAAPVGHLADLDPASRLAVVALRRWCDAGDAPCPAFAHLCGHCIAAARRPLMRHGTDCPCLGADEAAFAAFLRLAAEGERSDALMMAFAMLRPEAAPDAVRLAQTAGLMLRRMILQADRPERLH
jgi:hypothetical protein